MEEVLTGEVGDTSAEQLERANTLVAELGHEAVEDASLGLPPIELSDCVIRTLALPQVAALRTSLMPEFSVGYSVTDQSGEQVTVGVSDAVTYNADVWPTAVVDWKSDVNPQHGTIDYYRSHIGLHMQAVGGTTRIDSVYDNGQVY